MRGVDKFTSSKHFHNFTHLHHTFSTLDTSSVHDNKNNEHE